MTAALPDGWRDRLVKVQNDNTAAIGGQPRFTGWCLERHDLCVAKLVALREKDTNFVAALIDAGLVDSRVILERLDGLESRHLPAAVRARTWLSRWL